MGNFGRPVLWLFAFVYFFATSDADAQEVKVGGYVQFWYLTQQTPGINDNPGVDSLDNGYRVRRARLNFKTDLNEVFSIDSWLEFAGTGSILLDFKGIAKVFPEFIVTVGQFIPPVQMNEITNISASKIPFFERSDLALNLSSFMGTESYRDIGLMVGGQVEIFRYGVYYGNGRGRFNSAVPGSTGAGSILNRKFGQGLYGGRIDVEPVKGLFLGGHYAVNRQDSVLIAGMARPIEMDRSSFSLNIGTEGLAEFPAFFADIAYGKGRVNDGNSLDYNGWYATLGYRILPNLQVLGRYDTYIVENHAIGGTAALTTRAMNWTFGTTLYFYREKSEVVKVSLNYELRREDPTDFRNNVFVLWTQFKM